MSVTDVDDSVFEYQVADSWDEAVQLLDLWGPEAKLIAGGQSLVPMMNLRLAAPAALIDLNPIASGGPQVDGDELVIPAMTRHRAVLDSDLVRRHCPLLAHAIGFVGNVRVRNRGTIGGSVAHADPTGEIPAGVLASRGRLVVRGPAGERTIPAEEFFLTYLTTVLRPGEVITEVRLPTRDRREGWGFEEVTRRYSDFATVLAAVSLGETEDDVRVVLGGVAERPLMLGDDFLEPFRRLGTTPASVAEVAQNVADELSPDGDVHASADYRRRLACVLVERTLHRASGLA